MRAGRRHPRSRLPRTRRDAREQVTATSASGCTRAFGAGFAGTAAIVIGSDCPALTARAICARRPQRSPPATTRCSRPAEDGGYVLIGLTHASDSLFDGIGWGGPTVMAETRERLAALGWRWHEMATLWDVDRPQDLTRLRGDGDGTQCRKEKG